MENSLAIINKTLFLPNDEIKKEKKEIIEKFISISEKAINLYNKILMNLIELNCNLHNSEVERFNYLFGYMKNWSLKISATNGNSYFDVYLHLTIPISIPSEKILSFQIHSSEYTFPSKLTVSANKNVYIRLEDIIIKPHIITVEKIIKDFRLYFFYINSKPSLQFSRYLNKEIKNLLIRIINRSNIFSIIEKKLS